MTMSENWAARERHTNRLVGAIADHLIAKRTLSAEQIYGLCRLTWITADGEGADEAPYIKSTKLPALTDIFGPRLDTSSLPAAARNAAAMAGNPELAKLVRGHSGFTHFYAAYRKTVLGWIQANHNEVAAIVRAARRLDSDAAAEALARRIEALEGVPKANHPEQRMQPGHVLTPLAFCLDPRLRFPVINGRPGIQALLGSQRMRQAPLADKVRTMVGFIGKAGIRDAAALDAALQQDSAGDLATEAPKTRQVGKTLTSKPTSGKDLPLKDEADLLAIVSGNSQVRRRLHNAMTNRLKVLLAAFDPSEGDHPRAMFDVLLHGYRGKHDLLLEVKSSVDDADVRMAIGQLYAYAHHIQPRGTLHIAVVLPARPLGHLIALLDSLGIGCLWFDNADLERLQTHTPSLLHLTNN
jgi:hypothetical protein